MSEISLLSNEQVFAEVEQQFEAAFDRHVTKTKRDTISLDPYSMVPLEDYPELRENYRTHVASWAQRGIDIQPITKSVLLIDTATEANLPWYTTHIEEGFRPWHDWNARWTAEERSHEEIMLRDIEARGILDMSAEWLPTREKNMVAGIHPEVTTPADGIAYVATQELLTKMAHFHSARLMDAKGASSLRAVGADEGRHYNFYVSMLRALGQVNPDFALGGMRRQHEGNAFAMPGQKGIPNYKKHAATIALSGVFDSLTVLEAQKQTIDDAGLLELEPVTDEGKQAQEWASGVSEKTDKTWERKAKLMDIMRERAAGAVRDGELRPFILGRTVELQGRNYVAMAT